MKIIYGKRVVLTPFDKSDIDYFHFLLKHEGYLMGQCYFKDFDSYFSYIAQQILNKQILVWTGWTKNGKASEKIGFIALSDFTPWSAEIHGFSDKKIMKGLAKLLDRTDKYTYAEDSFKTLVDYSFSELKIHKLETQCFRSNRVARKLIEKVGFKREGLKIECIKIEGSFEDIYFYGLINPEKETKDVIRVEEKSSHNGSTSQLQSQPVLA